MHILFVCTANICRSPFAEHLARKLALERGITDVTFSSAGVLATDGAVCTPTSLQAGKKWGLEMGSHLANGITDASLEAADLVVVMEEEQGRSVRDLYPDWPRSRIQNLASYATGPRRPTSIPDPHRAGLWAHESSYRLMEQCIGRLLDGIVEARRQAKSA